MLSREVRNAVPKPINVNNPTFERAIIFTSRRQRFGFDETVNQRTHFLWRDASGERCRNRRENVTTMKCCALWMSEKVFVNQVASREMFFTFANPAEQPVVRADKHLFGALNQYRPAIGTYARIHDDNMNRSRRKISVGCKQIERRGLNVLRRDIVREVNDGGTGIGGKDYSFHRAYKIVLRAEVGKQSDRRLPVADCQFFDSPG